MSSNRFEKAGYREHGLWTEKCLVHVWERDLKKEKKTHHYKKDRFVVFLYAEEDRELSKARLVLFFLIKIQFFLEGEPVKFFIFRKSLCSSSTESSLC